MGFWTDVRRAARTLAREPGFSLVAVLTLALGIGANTAIFSIVNAVLLRPLAFREPDRLVSLREVLPVFVQTYPTLPVSARHFMEWRQRSSSFEHLSAFELGTVTLTRNGEPERLDRARVSADMFTTLGVAPVIGRGFAKGEDAEGRSDVAILSDGLWRRRFHADRSIVGKTVWLDSRPQTVVGVLPPYFRFPNGNKAELGRSRIEQPDVFQPKVFDADELKNLMGNFNYGVVARLRRGVTPAQAQAELNVIAAQLAKMSGENVELRASVMPLQESLVGGSRRGLVVLLGAVGSVLLIVCVNLANLMLARAERRSRESAVRTALGAGRGRLLRDAFIEAFLIALAGGALGCALAAAGLGALVRSAPADIPRLAEVALDARVLLFTLGVTTAAAVLFGLGPALRSASADPQTALRAGGRTATGGRGGLRLRSALVSAETALSALLLITAALLMTSFVRLLRVDKGFQAETVLAADVSVPLAKYSEPEQRNRFHDQVLAKLAAAPGVRAAALSTALPLEGETWIDTIAVPGDKRPPFERPPVNVRFASADYFRTMGIPLVEGRTFSDADRKRKVTVVSERVAGMLWPGQNAVGRRVTTGGEDTWEVIGVAGDVRTDADKRPVSMMYRPSWEWAPSSVVLVARAAGDPWPVAGAMRAAIHGVDSEIAIPRMRTMREVLAESVAQRRFQMTLASVFGAAALLLAALGIYGVVAYSVARRTNEFGIRLALGAQPADVNRMVIRQSMGPVVLGLAAGIAGALAAAQVLRSLLFEVSPRDPLTIAAVAAALAAVALAACYLPVRRVTGLNPLDALRYE